MPPIDDFGGLIDWPRLNAWIAGRNVPGAGPVTAARKLAGGIQNNVFLLERGGESLVLRRPARHLRANSNETMLREVRILNALAASAVPHPTVYAVCDDPAVIGACFYLMEPLEGSRRAVSCRAATPPMPPGDAAWARQWCARPLRSLP